MDWNIFIALGTIASVILTIVTGQWQVNNSINNKFMSFRELVGSLNDKILEKLEYHERHDDIRFDNIRKDIFTIQLNAARTDRCPAEVKKPQLSFLQNGKSES